jgi:hypothetical protein
LVGSGAWGAAAGGTAVATGALVGSGALAAGAAVGAGALVGVAWAPQAAAAVPTAVNADSRRNSRRLINFFMVLASF